MLVVRAQPSLVNRSGVCEILVNITFLLLLLTGGHLPVAVVLVLGFSNIFADALSMGVGEYLSSKVILKDMSTYRCEKNAFGVNACGCRVFHIG